MTLTYDQIEKFIDVYKNFNSLKDLELVSYMRELPREWNEYIVNSKISTAIKNNDKLSMKSLTEKCSSLCAQLGIDLQDKMKRILEHNETFYIDNVVYLQGAMEILNNFVDEKDSEKSKELLKELHPRTIEYLRELALGKEQYEILQILKDNDQI